MSDVAKLFKREIPMILVSVLMVTIFVNYYFETQILESVVGDFERWANVIAGFALYLGALSLVMSHGRKLLKRSEGWEYSVLTLGSLFFMIIAGFWLKPTSDLYITLYNNLDIPFNSTVRGLLGFYIVIAAYRAFKLHNLETSILLISAILLLLWNAPIGGAIWPGFKPLGDWLTSYPNAVVKRALRVIVGLGTVVWAMQIMIGRESRWVGEVMGGEE